MEGEEFGLKGVRRGEAGGEGWYGQGRRGAG